MKNRSNLHRTPLWTFLSICLFLLAACSTTPQTLVDYDTQYQFPTNKQFAWADSEDKRNIQNNGKLKTSKALNAENSDKQSVDVPDYDLLNKRITRFTQEALTQRGFAFNPNKTNANLLIDYEVRTQTLTAKDTYYYNPFGLYFDDCRYFYGCYPSEIRGETREYKYSRLFLVMRFLEAQNKKVVWQGIVELPTIKNSNNAQGYDTNIQRAINSLIAEFLPATNNTTTPVINSAQAD